MGTIFEKNRQLGRRVNREICNNQRFDLIPECFTEDFVADYSPRVIREGRYQIEQMVKAAHATFEGFRETVRHVVAGEDSVVLHFTITGKQVADWGPISASNLPVKYDEVVIMKIRDGKVYHQIGVQDTLLALQQLGEIPDPGVLSKNRLVDSCASCARMCKNSSGRFRMRDWYQAAIRYWRVTGEVDLTLTMARGLL